MNLLLLFLAVHQLYATTFILQDLSKTLEDVKCTQPRVRCIYSSDCFQDMVLGPSGHGSTFVLGDEVAENANLKPNCSMIIFRLPTGNSRRDELSVTVKQLAPGNSEETVLRTDIKEETPGSPVIGCVFKRRDAGGKDYLGAHFGVLGEENNGYKNSLMKDVVEWNMEKPFSCTYRVHMDRVHDILKNTEKEWTMFQTKIVIGSKRTDLDFIERYGLWKEEEFFYGDQKTMNLYNFLFEKRPKDDVKMKEFNAGMDQDFPEECNLPNVICLISNECVHADKYDLKCPARFIIRNNNDHTEVTMESLSPQNEQLALILHKDDGRTDKFECRKENENFIFSPQTEYPVSNATNSRINPNSCTFKILSKDTNEIFDIQTLSWEINNESHYQLIRPGQIHWNRNS